MRTRLAVWLALAMTAFVTALALAFALALNGKAANPGQPDSAAGAERVRWSVVRSPPAPAIDPSPSILEQMGPRPGTMMP